MFWQRWHIAEILDVFSRNMLNEIMKKDVYYNI